MNRELRFTPSAEAALRRLLSRAIADEDVLRLAGIILHGFRTEGNDAYFDGDDLFTPFERVRRLSETRPRSSSRTST